MKIFKPPLVIVYIGEVSFRNWKHYMHSRYYLQS